MKGVMPSVPPDILGWRRRTGADRWDEMWEEVLHMPPMPNRDHQDLKGGMAWYLRTYWARPRKCKVFQEINLALPGGWPNDYRIPDILLMTPARVHIDRNEYFEGAPDVVNEIRSPGDESLEKLAFYAGLGVPEVWIFDRDSKAPTLYTLAGEDYTTATPATDGWYRSAITQLHFRVIRPGKLTMRLEGDEATEEDLP